jgi:hypothetical protein
MPRRVSWGGADTNRPDGMLRLVSILLLAGVAAGGCTSRYELEQQRRLLEAQNVPPENFKPDLLAFLRTYLNNPENVRDAAMSEPQKLMVLDTERFAACLRYNARNSAGRYTGQRDHLAVFVSGKFDRMIELGRSDSDPAGGNERLRPLREHCARADYRPFPELGQLRR